MEVSEHVKQLVTPVVESSGFEVYDIELASGILRVTIDRKGGVDVDSIGDISKEISRLLDDADVIKDERYLLEVSSPGIERRLRVPQHFQNVIGSDVRVRLRSAIDGIRRFDGAVVSCDDTAVTFEVEGEPRSYSYDDLEDARTIFDWDAALKGNTPEHAEIASTADEADNSSNKKASAQ